jgi:hypothetical protein
VTLFVLFFGPCPPAHHSLPSVTTKETHTRSCRPAQLPPPHPTSYPFSSQYDYPLQLWRIGLRDVKAQGSCQAANPAPNASFSF